jgi:integrase
MLTVSTSATAIAGKGIVESDTKTRRTRTCRCHRVGCGIDARRLPDDPNALVFPNRRGGLLSNHEYRRAFDKAGGETGIIEDLIPHELRHTAASLAAVPGRT